MDLKWGSPHFDQNHVCGPCEDFWRDGSAKTKEIAKEKVSKQVEGKERDPEMLPKNNLNGGES